MQGAMWRVSTPVARGSGSNHRSGHHGATSWPRQRARIPALLLYVMPMLFITLTPYLSGYTRLQHATNNMLFITWTPCLFGVHNQAEPQQASGIQHTTRQPGGAIRPRQGPVACGLASELRLMSTVNTHSTQNAACRMQARAHDSPIPVPGADVAGVGPVPVQMWQRRAPVPVHVFIASSLPRATV